MNEKCRLPHVPGDVLFFTDPTTTEIYTLSLHDALPISRRHRACRGSRLGLVSLRAPRQPRAFFPGDLDLPRFVCAAVARVRVPRGYRSERAPDRQLVLAHRHGALRTRREVRRDVDLCIGAAARPLDRLVDVWREAQTSRIREFLRMLLT